LRLARTVTAPGDAGFSGETLPFRKHDRGNACETPKHRIPQGERPGSSRPTRTVPTHHRQGVEIRRVWRVHGYLFALDERKWMSEHYYPDREEASDDSEWPEDHCRTMVEGLNFDEGGVVDDA